MYHVYIRTCLHMRLLLFPNVLCLIILTTLRSQVYLAVKMQGNLLLSPKSNWSKIDGLLKVNIVLNNDYSIDKSLVLCHDGKHYCTKTIRCMTFPDEHTQQLIYMNTVTMQDKCLI